MWVHRNLVIILNNKIFISQVEYINWESLFAHCPFTKALSISEHISPAGQLVSVRVVLPSPTFSWAPLRTHLPSDRCLLLSGFWIGVWCDAVGTLVYGFESGFFSSMENLQQITTSCIPWKNQDPLTWPTSFPPDAAKPAQIIFSEIPPGWAE